ncbi:MAG TPA: iron ABC transporter substrate-binding protein [Pseudonocardiaceae bacterium]
MVRGRFGQLVTLTVVAAAAATVLAGCGGDDSGVDEDKLVIYSGRQEGQVKPIIDRFQEETGIEVSVRYGNTAQLAAQLIEEGEGTPADVFFSQDGGALGALTNQNRLEKLPDEVLNRVPEQYRAENGTWVGTSGRSRVIVYNPDLVPEADVPDSVFELTEPTWKGKVGIAPSNASFESFVTAIRVIKGDDVAAAWLRDLKANDVQTFDNNILILNAVKEGVVPLGLINHYYWYEQVAEEGRDKMKARLKFLPGGDPGALVNVAGAAVLAGSDKADQARRFVEFLLGDESQAFFAEHTKEYPLVAGVDPVDDLPALDTLQAPDIDLSDLDTLERTLSMIQDAGLT